jgi:3-oxoacyl-[acyl-carrier-protein] synthase II
MLNKHRVVITGVGVVAPNGVGKEAFWQALKLGLSGVQTIRRFDPGPFDTKIGGEVTTFDPLQFMDQRELKKIDRSNTYAIAASHMALEDSGLDLKHENLERIGSSIGNSAGGVDFLKKEVDVMDTKGPHWTSPYLAIAFFPCGTNGLMSIRFGIKGVVLTLCNGNTSGSDAIGMAFRTIQSGRADVMFAGGTEAPLIPLFVGSMSEDGYLSKQNANPGKAMAPFDRSAGGMVLGEGAGLLVLESLEHAQNRGAPIYGEIAGYASASSAFDVLRPDNKDEGLLHTMRRAMKEAQVTAEDVDVINGQGLSIPEYDSMESRCMWEEFKNSHRQPLVTAVGSWIGNSLGALGGIQAVAGALMMQHQTVPALANFQTAGDLRYPMAFVREPASSQKTDVIVQNSFCFLGKSSTLIMRRNTL